VLFFEKKKNCKNLQALGSPPSDPREPNSLNVTPPTAIKLSNLRKNGSHKKLIPISKIFVYL